MIKLQRKERHFGGIRGLSGIHRYVESLHSSPATHEVSVYSPTKFRLDDQRNFVKFGFLREKVFDSSRAASRPEQVGHHSLVLGIPGLHFSPSGDTSAEVNDKSHFPPENDAWKRMKQDEELPTD